MKNQDWRKVLLKAADVIEKRGWIKGTLEGSAGRVCAIGAINLVESGVVDAGRMALRDSVAISKLGCYLNNEVDIWNDVVAKSSAEVMAVMKDCACTFECPDSAKNEMG